MVHLGDISRNLIKIFTNAVSTLLLIVIFFILQFLFNMDFPCSCTPGVHPHDVMFLCLPPLILTSVVTLIEPLYQKWICCCSGIFCKNFWSCFVMFCSKYFFLGTVWISTVLIDGDWYFCLVTNLNTNQTGIPCKNNLTYEETLIKAEYKNESLVDGLAVISVFFLVCIIWEFLKGCYIRYKSWKRLVSVSKAKLELLCPPYYRWFYEKLLSEEVSDHLKDELRKIAKERAIELCKDYLTIIRNNELHDNGNSNGNDNPNRNGNGNDNPNRNDNGNDNPNRNGNDNPNYNPNGIDNPNGNGFDNPNYNPNGNDNPNYNPNGIDNPNGNGFDNPNYNPNGNDNPNYNPNGNDNNIFDTWQKISSSCFYLNEK